MSQNLRAVLPTGAGEKSFVAVARYTPKCVKNAGRSARLCSARYEPLNDLKPSGAGDTPCERVLPLAR